MFGFNFLVCALVMVVEEPLSLRGLCFFSIDCLRSSEGFLGLLGFRQLNKTWALLFLSLLVTAPQLGAEQCHCVTGTCIPSLWLAASLQLWRPQDNRMFFTLWEEQLLTEGLWALGELDASDSANESCFLPEEQQQNMWFTCFCSQVRAF